MPLDPPPVAACILAGGRARRLGGVAKATLPVGPERIVDRQIRLLARVADPIFLVANDPAPYAALGLRTIPDAIADQGPLGGIYTAIQASPRERTIVVACDLPYLPLPLLQRFATWTQADLVIPRGPRGYEPLCAVWSKACLDAVRRRIESGNVKAALVVEDVRVEVIEPAVLASYDPHGLLFVNVNTPHDYERAQRLSEMESNSPRDRIMDVSSPPEPESPEPS